MGSPVPIPGSDEAGCLEAGQPTQLWKNLFEISPDAQVVCRLDGTVEQVNPRAAAFLKINLTGSKPVSIFHSLLPPADQRLKEILRNPDVQPDHLNSAAMFAPGASCGLIDIEVAPLGPLHRLVI